MSIALVLVLVLVTAILLIRRLTDQHIPCNSCLAVVSKRTMTHLADGGLICKCCLKRKISSALQLAASRLPGAQKEGVFALELGDKRIGQACAICSQKIHALDEVCESEGVLSHLVCTQLAERLAARLKDSRA